MFGVGRQMIAKWHERMQRKCISANNPKFVNIFKFIIILKYVVVWVDNVRCLDLEVNVDHNIQRNESKYTIYMSHNVICKTYNVPPEIFLNDKFDGGVL